MMSIEIIALVVQEHRNDALRAAEQSRLVRLAMQATASRRTPLRARVAELVTALVQFLRG